MAATNATILIVIGVAFGRVGVEIAVTDVDGRVGGRVADVGALGGLELLPPPAYVLFWGRPLFAIAVFCVVP